MVPPSGSQPTAVLMHVLQQLWQGWICQQLLPPQVKSLTPVVSCSRHQWPQRWRRFHWGVLKDSLLRQEALSILPVLSLPEYSARQESCIRLQTASSPIVAGAAA